MSDLGLSNLAKLKARLLPASLSALTTYDTKVTQVGRGVARLLEKFCNRSFGRVVGETETFSADRAHWIVNRYPIESISAVAQQDDLTTGYVSLGAVNSVLANWDAKNGIVHFGSIMGTHLSQVRLTYTGGYFYDTAEDGATALPSGATLLPYDVEEAYYLQCLAVWQVMDKLGVNLASAGGGEGGLLGLSLPGLDLIPEVKTMLAGHIRYQIT